MVKNIAVVKSGTNEIVDVEIRPGSTVGDVLTQLELVGYRMSLAGDDGLLDEKANIYELVKDGEKVYISPLAEAG